jgi:hypothetical protein
LEIKLQGENYVMKRWRLAEKNQHIQYSSEVKNKIDLPLGWEP